MLFVLTILPLALGLTVVMLAIMRKLKSQPAMEPVESSKVTKESGIMSELSGTSQGWDEAKTKHQKEVFK